MEIEFHGAAREVTGSCHILRVNGRTVLLDCGLFQGRRSDAEQKNRRLPVPVGTIDAVILSHAHIDHAGRLPFLAHEGLRATIWCTPATRDLSAIMLADSAHIQEKDAEYLSRRSQEVLPPLYTVRDASRAVDQMVSMPCRRAFDVIPGVRAEFAEAGHILGSASVVLDCAEGSTRKRIVFSGDIGRRGLPIIRDPEPPGGADIMIMESTYGNRDHTSVAGSREALGKVVRDTAARGGKILIPAFAVGRTQEIVYDLNVLRHQGAIPAIPICIDSPLATDATAIFAMHPELFDETEEMISKLGALFDFPMVRYTRDVEASKALDQMLGPAVIIAASGMAESGRILHHLKHGAGNPKNTILIVGFQAEHTLGRRIVERQSVIKVFGEELPLRAEVQVLNGYSAHADRRELQTWLDAVRAESPALGTVRLVHGEPPAQAALAAQLNASGYHVECPAPGDRVTL